MISRLLIANRGEIAVRVARAARESGIVPLGIYSDADERAYHLRFMEASARVGPAPAADSYLDIDAILRAARALRADAVHPGYGFLSERAAFAQAVGDAGLIFVGPPPQTMAAMGSKAEAKRRVRDFDVPILPGYHGEDQHPDRLRAEALTTGLPLLIKASAGGGGRGMRVVETIEQFDEALESAKREALAAFGSDVVLLERYLRDPRHIEFQILADAFGNTIHVGERECSIQRRHQKIVEEAPSVALTPELRAIMGQAAVRAARSVGYVNAGTVEFMLDRDGAFSFLEMNTRLQVEHPVTEAVYGIDLVRWQLRIAGGERLTIAQDDVRPRGWAIEARIYAEDPANHMLPSTGTIAVWEPPQGPGVRLDGGVDAGSEVGVYYDPMLAKLIVSGSDRAQTIARLRAALEDFTIGGVRTNLPLLRWIARDDAFAAGETTTSFLAQRLDESIFVPAPVSDDVVIAAARGLFAGGYAPWRIAGVGIPLRLAFGDDVRSLSATRVGDDEWRLDGDVAATVRAEGAPVVRLARTERSAQGRGDAVPIMTVAVDGEEYAFRFAAALGLDAGAGVASGGTGGRVSAPMPGKIVKVAVAQGDAVTDRALLVVLEAMKMEHRIEAPGTATVREVLVHEGDVVSAGAPLIELAP